MSSGWAESNVVVVSFADLIRIPEFKEYVRDVEQDQTIEYSIDEEKAKLLKEHFKEVIEEPFTPTEGEPTTHYTWVRKGLPIGVIKKFMVDHLNASPKHKLELDFCLHRTVQGEVYTGERYSMIRKGAKYVEKELFDELNEMQKTSLLGG